MVELVQDALAARGIKDEVLAAGQFNPRGHTGGMFAGGLAGGETGSLLGDAGEIAGAEARIHQRVNVRVLELIDDASASRIELEGNRLPLTHSKDVIDALRG